MARKRIRSLRSYIAITLMAADSTWFEEDCKESTGERDDEYYEFLAKKVIKMLEEEGYLL